MADLCMVREGRKLVPATKMDWERLGLFPVKQPLQVQTTFQRSSPLNRWYRGLVGIVAEGLDMAPEALHVELKFRAGLVRHILMGKKGVVVVNLKSTAFNAMDDAEFREYVNLATELIFKDFLPGVRRKDVYKRVEEWVGPRPHQ